MTNAHNSLAEKCVNAQSPDLDREIDVDNLVERAGVIADALCLDSMDEGLRKQVFPRVLLAEWECEKSKDGGIAVQALNFFANGPVLGTVTGEIFDQDLVVRSQDNQLQNRAPSAGRKCTTPPCLSPADVRHSTMAKKPNLAGLLAVVNEGRAALSALAGDAVPSGSEPEELAARALNALDEFLICSAKDKCETCHGEKGGVPGNENIIGGQIMCDYCVAARTPKAAPGQVSPLPT